MGEEAKWGVTHHRSNHLGVRVDIGCRLRCATTLPHLLFGIYAYQWEGARTQVTGGCDKAVAGVGDRVFRDICVSWGMRCSCMISLPPWTSRFDGLTISLPMPKLKIPLLPASQMSTESTVASCQHFLR